MKKRRMLTVIGVAFGVLMLTATSALAHICYNTSRSTTGNVQAASNSDVFVAVDFESMIAGARAVCPPEADDEIDAVENILEQAGLLDELFVTNTKHVMASGAVNSPTDVLHDGKGIDHLPGSLFAAVEALEDACPVLTK